MEKKAFSLALSPTFKQTVTLSVSTEQGRVQANFTAIFKRTSKEEWQKLLEANTKDADLILEKLVGWEDIDGEFSAENLQRLLDIDGMEACLVHAFMEGNAVAPRKN